MRVQNPGVATTTTPVFNHDDEVATRYGHELSMEDLLKKRGVRLMVLMDGEFSETPRNRAERRAAEEQLLSVARMQIKRSMAGWGKKKVAAL